MKRFLAILIAGVVFMSQAVFAAEMPENYWAAESMNMAELFGWCEADRYADKLSFEDGNEAINSFLAFQLYDSTDLEQVLSAPDYTNRYVTRGEWAQAMSRCIDIACDEAAELMGDEADIVASGSVFDHSLPHYTDVTKSDEYYDEIVTCYIYNIMFGYSDGSFRSEEYITCAEAMTALVNLWYNIEDIMEDKGIDQEELYNIAYDYNNELDEYMYEFIESLEDIMDRAEKGTLKSSRKLSGSTEKAVEEYINGMEKLFDAKDYSYTENGIIDIDAAALGEEIKGSISITQYCAVISDDEGKPEQAAVKMSLDIDLPILEAMLGAEGYTDNNIVLEMYLKDGVLYQNLGGEKYKIDLDTAGFDFDEELSDIQSTNLMMKKTNSALNDYIIREGIINGSVSALGNGSKKVSVKLDIKKILSAIGLDLDKVIELSGEEIEIEISPNINEYIIDSQGKVISSEEKLSVSFNAESEGASGKLSVSSRSDFDYGEDTEIEFPDFKGYKDYEDLIDDELFSDLYTEEDNENEDDILSDNVAIIGGADGPADIFAA